MIVRSAKNLMCVLAAAALLAGSSSTAQADRGDRYSGGRSIDDRARDTFRYDDRRTSSRDYDRSRADYTVDRSRYVTRYYDSSPRYESNFRYDSGYRHDSGRRYYSSRPSYSVSFGYGSGNCYDYGRDRVSFNFGYSSGGYYDSGARWSVGFGYSNYNPRPYYYAPAPPVYYYSPPVYAPSCGGYWGGGYYNYWR
jgi:hypothetical protein